MKRWLAAGLVVVATQLVLHVTKTAMFSFEDVCVVDAGVLEVSIDTLEIPEVL